MEWNSTWNDPLSSYLAAFDGTFGASVRPDAAISAGANDAGGQTRQTSACEEITSRAAVSSQ